MREKQKKQWERVRTTTDLQEAIRLVADVGEEAVLESEVERGELRAQALDIHKILVGNGDPNKGLLSRVERIEEQVGEVKKQVESIRRLLIGDVESGADCDTLLDKVKRSTTLANNASRIGWLVVGIVVADIVGRLLKLY